MKFSVITVNYNNAEGLERTIGSVISQTFRDFEYIIVDGGSTDGSADVIRKYASHVGYWVSEKDRGIYHAMNKGVAQAHGEYCIFMNSGDVFYDEAVLRSVFDERHDEDIITGITIGRDDNDIRFSTEGEVTFLTLFRSTLSHQSSFIRTDLLRSHPYNEKLRIVSDWQFWIESLILADCSHVFIQVKVARIDLTGVSVTNNQGRESERAIVLSGLMPRRVLEDYEPLRYADDEMIRYVARLSKTYRLRRMALFLLKHLSRLAR